MHPKRRWRLLVLVPFLCIAAQSGAFGQDFQRFQVSGDFRLRVRYDGISGEPERTRASLRFRFNTTLLLSNTLSLYFGFATGTGNPRTRNLTFDDFLSAKPVWIDHAYIEWRPISQLTFLGGKMKNPIWESTSFLWDGDITPEGFAIQGDTFSYPLSAFWNTGLFSIGELQTEKDPLLIPVQLGLNYAFENGASIKFAGIFYLFTHLENLVPADPDDPYFDYSAGTNTIEAGSLKYDYKSLGASTEVFFPNVLPPYMPTVILLGEYIYNFDPPSQNQGFLVGVKLGHLDVFSFKEWRLFYGYFYLGRDAWLDIFPESIYLSGATNITGHALIADIGVANRIWVRLQFGYAREIVGDKRQILGAGDLNFAF